MTVPPAVAAALGDRYAIERELGRGGMATVYLAEDLKHHRQVALKVLRPELAASIGPGRFVQEIDILARLTHPHILPLHDSGAADGVLYYVMPYVAGESLRARLERERQLPISEAVRIADEVADALGYAHTLGVVHRDIKPENILLESGHAVVADFGIARAVGEAGSSRLTDTGFAVGTPAYMSPEQAAGDRGADHRTDLYALGCVLYEMLSGETPHTGATPQAILARVLTEKARPLTTVRPAVTPAMEEVVLTALSRTPADRYATAGELRAALAAATTSGAAPARPRRRRLSRRTGLGLMVVAAAALGVVAGRALLDRAPAGTDRLSLALFPFQATAPAAEEWVEQIPDLLATLLDGTPGVRVADPWALWGNLRSERGARARSPTDLDDAEALARRTRAGSFLLGSIRVDGEGGRTALGVTVRVYRVGSPDAVHTVTRNGTIDAIGALVQELAVDLMTYLEPTGRGTVPELEGFTSRSAAAVKAYLRAKEAMRRGQVDLAEAAIDSALAIDTTFAVAMVEATLIKTWAQSMRGRMFTGLRNLTERATRHGDSLGPRNRLRLEAVRASVRTEGAIAAAATRQLLARDSTDLGAWQSLAYYHTAYGWQYGSGEADAVEALEHAIALDSTHVPSLVAMRSLLEQVGDARATRYLELLRRTDTSSILARGALLAHGAVTMPETAFASAIDTLALLEPPLLVPVLRSLRTARPDRAAQLVDRIRGRQGPGVPDFRNEWARYLAAQGRYRALDSAVRAGSFPAQMAPRWFLVAPLLTDVGDSTRAHAAAADLEALLPADSARAWHETRPVWINGWMVGAFNASFEDTLVAQRWQAAIGTLPAGGTSPDYRGSLQADIQARMLARRGDRVGALAAATRAYELWGVHTENVPEFQPEPHMRFHYAMLLLAGGERDSATILLRSLVPPTTWLGFLTARASLELGRLAEDRGDRAAAGRHYSLAYRLWRPADPEIAAWKNAAREGLSRVTGEPISP